MAAPLPALVRELSDRQLAWLTDPGAFARGSDYFRRRRVLSIDDLGTRVTGRVVGNGALYATAIELRPHGVVVTRCSCPVRTECKHVVAVVLAARAAARDILPDAASPSPDPAPQPAWERQLDQALGDVGALPAPGTRVRSLALHLKISVSKYDGSATVALIPLLEGAKGGWVKTGASWRELEYGPAYYAGATRMDPRQAAALREMMQVARAARAQQWAPVGDTVELGHLGTQWAAHLRGAVLAGVQLLTDPRAGGDVHVLDTACGVTATVTAPASGEPGRVAFALELPAAKGGAPWRPFADAHHAVVGWVATHQGDVTLVPASAAVDLPRRQLLAVGSLEIPAQDWARFVLTRLPAIRETVATQVPFDVVVEPPRLHVAVTHHAGHVSDVNLSYAYVLAGSGEALQVPLAWDAQPVRDRDAEQRLTAELAAAVTLPELWEVPGRLAAHTRVTGLRVADLVAALEALRERDDVLVRVEGQPAAYAEALDAPAIAVGTSQPDGGVTDWFDLTVSVTVGGEDVPLGELIQALATGQERMLLATGTWFRLDRPELHQLASALAEARMLQDAHSDGLRITPLHAGLWEQLVELGVVSRQSEEWTRRVAALTDVASREAIAVPHGLEATLRDYQVEGFRWMSALWEAGLGGILADDMGLGKTVQVLAAVLRAHEAGALTDPVLIVCPTSVVPTWAHEAARFAPGLTVRVLDSTHRTRGVPLEDAIAGAHLVVTSYAILRLDEAQWSSRPWSALVLDEAQFVKNHRSKGYQAARKVRARATFALTGTPLENSLMDLWSLLSLTAPGLYPHPERFKQHYVTPIEKQGAVGELAALKRRLRPLMVRRTKEAVAAELPPKQEVVVHVPLAPKHRAIYDRHLLRERQRLLGLVENFDSNRIAILRALTTLRQLSLDPGLVDAAHAGVANPAKVDLLVEQLHELAAEGHRALVFSQFTGFLSVVRARLEAEGLAYCYLDGRTRKREEQVQRFRDGTQVAFLISLKAGGFGLTLTEADYVYVLDPWWNPAAEMQAVDRTHRIGQDKQVFVYRLVSEDTIEEKVVALQQRKRDLFGRVVDDDAGIPRAIGADDVRALLGLAD